MPECWTKLLRNLAEGRVKKENGGVLKPDGERNGAVMAA
jgi:hypothetical protein